jgi:threonine/homoserine/homoserine lactone efflux protein
MVYERLGGKQASGFFLSSSILFFLAVCSVIIHTQQPSGAPKCALGAIVSFIMNTFTITLVALYMPFTKWGWKWDQFHLGLRWHS